MDNSEFPLKPDAPNAELVPAASASAPAEIDFAPLKVPEFRDSTPAEMQQAETLLREANRARLRENYREAEAKCRQALELVPRDGIALELLGDLLQGVARVDEALLAYKRATLAAPARAAAERKYADLLMRQQDWVVEDPEALPKNPWASTLLSCLLPGVGQILNGELRKGVVLLSCFALCLLGLIFWGGVGLSGAESGAASTAGKGAAHRVHSLNVGILLPSSLLVIIVIYAAADANTVARGGGAAKSQTGWEV